MHLLVGDPSQESSELIRLFSGVGVSAPNAVIEFEGNIFLPHHTGFYLFDGSTPNLISHKIQTFVTDSIDWVLAYDEMCAEYYADHIWISCPVVNSGGTRSFVYHLDTDKWGNMSFAASAYHRTLSPSDTNKFFICLKDSGSACVYKGYDDGGDGIYAEYRTGWDLFGTQAVKELTGYYITYDKSATCTLTVDIAPRDTIVWADSSSKWSSINSSLTQSYHDVRRNVTGGKAHGRYLQLGLNMYSSAGEGWISRITLELAEKEEKAYDR